MAAENTVKLLWDCANTLNTGTHTNKLLKSYYMSTSRKIAKHKIQMPKEKFSASQMCPHCSIFWDENEFHLKLQPQKVANNSKARKLIAKLEESIATNKKGLLTKKQKRRAKWLKKRVTSIMEIHCEYCGHKTIVPLEKPNSIKELQKKNPEEVQVQQTKIINSTKTKKKKNKSKNKTAGLNIPQGNVVEAKNEKVRETEFNPIKTAVTPLKNVAAKKVAVTPTIANANLNQSLIAKKRKGKGAIQPVAPKIQSKTKQKNSLLHLASLLKTQASKSSTNTMQDRLKSLLK